MIERPVPHNRFVAFQYGMPGATGHLNPGDYGIPNPSGGGSLTPDSGSYNRYSSDLPPWQNPYDYQTDANIWGLNQAQWAGMAQAGPWFEMNRAGRDIMAGQIQQQGVQYGKEQGYLNQDYYLGQQKLNNQQATYDAQRDALNRQPGFLTTLHDIAQRGFANDKGSIALQSDITRRNLNAQMATAGTYDWGGANQQRGDVAQKLYRDITGVNLESEGETAKYFENMAEVGDQRRILDAKAKDLGIDRQQLTNDLQRGLDRLGLSNFMTVSDLLQRMNSSNMEDAMRATDIYNEAFGRSDYYARQYPGQNAAEGFGGPSDNYKLGPGAR